MISGALIDKLKKYKFFEEFLEEKSLAQFKKYLVAGFTSFGIEYILFCILIKIIKLDDRVSNVILYSILFWFVFFINRFWSFQSKGNLRRQLFYYVILFTFNLTVANIGLYNLFTRIFGISELLAKPLLMCFVVSWNFIYYKKVIYKT